jgi:hypothetical protein
MSEEPPSDGREAGSGRFAKGNKASRGRQVGARHKVTLLAEKLFSDDAAKIIKKVVAEAQNGQSWACKLVIERIIPPARDRPTPLDLPKIASPADLPDALARIVDAMAEGALTPSEAAAIVTTLEAYGRASVFAGHEERLAALEARLREGEE